MNHPRFNNILKGYKCTRIDIIAEKSANNIGEIKFKLTGRYSIMADEQHRTAYKLDCEILNAEQIKKDKDGIDPSIRYLLSVVFAEYLKGEGEAAVDGRSRFKKLRIDNISSKERQQKPRNLAYKIAEYSKKIGELDVTVKGSISYQIPEFLR
ncbi:hypothetical protein HYU07_01565 [Candidatus Woesearchaeota archaeon]|nr:hypothetical protein [Candidatus Woesearchaeota archaeon]